MDPRILGKGRGEHSYADWKLSLWQPRTDPGLPYISELKIAAS
jgi:hypothetical protein